MKKKLLMMVVMLGFFNRALKAQEESLCTASVISVHEHELKEDVVETDYEYAMNYALTFLKYTIPGLQEAFLLKSFKGSRTNKYAVLWLWEDKETIEKNFGTLENPSFPPWWLWYEDVILAPYLKTHPNSIVFSCYQKIANVFCDDQSFLEQWVSCLENIRLRSPLVS